MIIEKKKDIRGAEIYWLENEAENVEQRPLAIFLHGFPDNATCWSNQLEHFKDDYHFIAPFSYGTHPQSKTKVKKERYKSDSYCLDLIDLINHIDPSKKRKILFIAHDMGGVVADKLSLMLEENRVLGAVFINSMGLNQFFSRKKNPYQLVKSYYMYIFQVPRVADSIFKAAPKKMLNKIYDWGHLPKDDEMRKHGVEVFSGVNLYRQYLKELFNLKNEKREKSKIPTLFIWGENDTFLEVPTYDEIENLYENVEIRVLDTNHWVHRSHPERVNEILEDTFNKWL